MVIHRYAQSGEKSRHWACRLPAEGKRGDALPPCVGSHTLKQVLFVRSVHRHIVHISCTHFCVILLFKMVPKHSAEVLSSIPKYKKAGMGLMEETTCIRLSFVQARVISAIGHEFIVMNQQYRLNKMSLMRNTQNTRLRVDW